MHLGAFQISRSTIAKAPKVCYPVVRLEATGWTGLKTHSLRVCWLGGTRYTNPLNPTQDKKWRRLHDDLGITIDIISFAPGLRPRYFAPHAHFYLLPALPVAVLRYVTMFTLGPLLLLWLVRWRGVSVIVTNDPYFGAIGAWVKQRCGGRPTLIIESHADFEVAVFMQRRMPLAGLVRRLMRHAARYALSHADLLRAVSSTTRDQLAALAPHLPMHQFMTWSDFDIFQDTPRTLPPSQSFDLAYVGVLVPRKGVHYLLDAFARLAADFPAARLWLIGSPDNPAYARQLEDQAQRLGIRDQVTFTGGLKQQALADQLSHSRALILPSSSEGLPRVVIEGMLAGLPIVATRVAGIPDVVTDGVSGYLFPPEDADALYDALYRILEGADVDAMGAAARAFALDFFSADAYVDGYRELLAEAASIGVRR